jgi:hypothetical protein
VVDEDIYIVQSSHSPSQDVEGAMVDEDIYIVQSR